MSEERILCNSCGTAYNKMFLMGKQGNVDICPMCGAKMNETTKNHSDWITWYYYKDPKYGDFSLWDKLPLNPEELELIKEFKAPPESECGLDEVKRILRTYVPDAFVYEQMPETETRCPYCRSKDIQLVPKRFSILTGFATNRYDRMCVHCKRKF